MISEKNEAWQHQLDQKANTHSRIWIVDDLPCGCQYGFILGHFGHFTVRILVAKNTQRTDAAIASVLRVDDIHRSHLIAEHRGVQARPAVVLDTGIKLGSHINDGILPKVIR
jgi:hypothetical protein